MAIDPETRSLTLDGGDVLHGRTIILATGVSWRRLTIPGFEGLIGKGIYYGAARSEAGVTQGLDIHLIGAGNSAGQAAMFFANHARTVTLVVRGDSLEQEHVAVSDRPDRRQIEHQGRAGDRGPGGQWQRLI